MAIEQRTRKSEPVVRRTQEERRTSTIRKLLEAAADELVDVGYGDATVQAVCARAGVSQGALFRHFPTREALMVATGQDVGLRTLESFKQAFEASKASAPPTVLAMRLLREHVDSRLNQAWHELMTAARTRPALRDALAPTLRDYYESIVQMARETLPELAIMLGDAFPMVVRTMVAVYDGEHVRSFVLGESLDDPKRAALLGMLASRQRRPR